MIGIALMGAGRMARVHAKAIGEAGGRLVIVYDVVESAAKSLAADNKASVARSVDEALQDPNVDAVLVVTSSDTHVDLILRAIKAGKAVMWKSPSRRTCLTRSDVSMFWALRPRMSCSHSIGVLIPDMLRSRRRSMKVKLEGLSSSQSPAAIRRHRRSTTSPSREVSFEI